MRSLSFKRLRKARPTSVVPAAMTLAVLAVALSGCTGFINNNPDFRWFLFSHFGVTKLCPEMVKQGVPIKVDEGAPASGRFFPNQCSVAVDDARHVVVVNVAGSGYGFVAPAKRVGFTLSTAVEYRPDFTLAGPDTYLYAKMNRVVGGPDFRMTHAENPVIGLFGALPVVGGATNVLGQEVVMRALTQGFTVIHNEDRGNDFALGILRPPQRPHHPFNVSRSDRFTFANETTDVPAGERDFLGPFEVGNDGKGLFVSLQVQGPGVSVIIVDKQTGDAWRGMYETGKALWPVPGRVMSDTPVAAGGADARTYPLYPGQYYVVIDNTRGSSGLLPSVLNPFGIGMGNTGMGTARVSVVAQRAD